MRAPPTDEQLAALLTGLVVESLTVKQDFTDGTVGCRGCEGKRLDAGDDVTVTISRYEGHSWEIQAVYCGDHRIAGVDAVMDIRAETQAVVTATLTRGRYQSARGDVEPNALVLDAVEVVDMSPASAGY
jgi:hypothetical protein